MVAKMAKARKCQSSAFMWGGSALVVSVCLLFVVVIVAFAEASFSVVNMAFSKDVKNQSIHCIVVIGRIRIYCILPFLVLLKDVAYLLMS